MTRPEVSSGFVWTAGPAGRSLVCEAVARHASHVFTTRQLRFRDPGREDDERRLAAAISVAPDRIVRATQVHGTGVLVVTAGAAIAPGSAADALVSTDTARAVSVYVADCVPVIVADRRRRVVAAIHAGWRGTAARVVPAAIEAITALGVAPSDLIAAIGPSIGPCCYQVDAPVRSAFLAADAAAVRWMTADGADHWKLDLWQANVEQLIEAGLSPASIHAARFCTAEHLEDCYSYRKEGAGTGRMAAAVALSAVAARS